MYLERRERSNHFTEVFAIFWEILVALVVDQIHNYYQRSRNQWCQIKIFLLIISNGMIRRLEYDL